MHEPCRVAQSLLSSRTIMLKNGQMCGMLRQTHRSTATPRRLKLLEFASVDPEAHTIAEGFQSARIHTQRAHSPSLGLRQETEKEE
jgi:hypothetical protein